MQKEIFEQFAEFNRYVARPFNDLNKLTTGIVKRVTEQNLAIIDDMLNSSIKQLKDIGSVKKMEDAIALQTAFANEASAKILSSSQKLLNTSLENFADFSKWLEESTNNTAKAATTTTSSSSHSDKK